AVIPVLIREVACGELYLDEAARRGREPETLTHDVPADDRLGNGQVTGLKDGGHDVLQAYWGVTLRAGRVRAQRIWQTDDEGDVGRSLITVGLAPQVMVAQHVTVIGGEYE